MSGAETEECKAAGFLGLLREQRLEGREAVDEELAGGDSSVGSERVQSCWRCTGKSRIIQGLSAEKLLERGAGKLI